MLSLVVDGPLAAKVRFAAGPPVSLTMHELPSRLAARSAVGANRLPTVGSSGLETLERSARYQPVKEAR